MYGKKKEACIIGALLWHDVGLLTWSCGVPNSLDPINLEVVGVVCLNNLPVTYSLTTPFTHNVSD